MGQPVVHFEITGRDPVKLRSYYSELFGWEFHTGDAATEAVMASQRETYEIESPAGHFVGRRGHGSRHSRISECGRTPGSCPCPFTLGTPRGGGKGGRDKSQW